MKLLLTFIFAISAFPVFSQQELPSPGPLKVPIIPKNIEVWRDAHYSDVRYTLDLSLEKMSPVLKGTIEIHVKVTQPRSETPAILFVPAGSKPLRVPPIILDWRRIAGHERDSTISNVTINGRSAKLYPNIFVINRGRVEVLLTYWEQYQHLVFADGVVLGENVIKLNFTSPILASGSAITRYIDKENGSEYIYSQLGPSEASTAFPTFDQPDLEARFKLGVTAPKSWRIATNTGANTQIIADGICGLPIPGRALVTTSDPPCEMSDIWGFEETKPISTYAFAFIAGAFHDKNKVPDLIRRTSPSLVW